LVIIWNLFFVIWNLNSGFLGRGFDAFGAGFDSFAVCQSHPLQIGILPAAGRRIIFAAKLY